MIPSRKTLSVLLACVVGGQASLAAEQPFFRFQVGKSGEANAQALRFDSAQGLSDGPVGTPASATFSVSGGKAPYRVDLIDAPSGLAISKVSETTWAVSGTLSPVGEFTSAIVRVTDAVDTSASQAIPVRVIAAGVASEAPLSFASAQAVPSGIVGTAVQAAFVAKGGKPPYSMQLLNAPAGLTFTTTDQKRWVVGGSLAPAGAYPTASVRLSDATGGAPVTYGIPLTVTDPGTPQSSLSFASGDALASGPVGTRVRGYYVASGGKGPYAMSLVSAPPGVTLTKVDEETWTAAGMLREPGSYQAAIVRLTDATTPSGVEYPVPVNVTAAAPLSFSYATDLPGSFPALAPQYAFFGVNGGVAPLKWEVSAAPSSVIASGDAQSGYVAAVVETPGLYTGATLTVTDAVGQVATRTLPDFTVTQGTGTKLQVTGLPTLPQTIRVGERFDFSGAKVSGTTGRHLLSVAVLGSGSNRAAYVGQESYDGSDPVQVGGSFVPKAADSGMTYDITLVFSDYDKPENSVVVPWGRISVVETPLRVSKGFDTLYKGKSGSVQQAFAKITGGSGTYDFSMDQPAGFNLQAYSLDCSGYYTDCSPYAVAPGEIPVLTGIDFPAPGVAKPFRVVVTDRVTGEKLFLPAITVESEKTDPMTKISDFPTPITVDASPGGYASFPSAYAMVANGSNLVTVDYTVTGGNGVSVFGSWINCGDGFDNRCSQAGAKPGENMIGIDASLPSEGTFDITVTATDPASASSVTFNPISVTVNGPPVSSCQFKPLQVVAGAPSTVRDVVSFSGGKAPFQVEATGTTGISIAATRNLAYGRRSADVSVAADASGTSMHVTVSDSRGQSCEGDVSVAFVPVSAGDQIDVVAIREGFGGYTTSHFLTGDSQGPVFNLAVTAEQLTSLDFGPQGVHPDTEGVLLGFVSPEGLSVTGYGIAAVDTPVGYLGLIGPDQYGYRDPSRIFLQNLHLTGSETQFLPGDYKYQFYVFLSDGSYRLSKLIAIRMN